MQNHINFLEINHFKSIKNLKIDCKRVNVFIGKPNVGKSNILEAMALLGGSRINNFMKTIGLVRYNKLDELFFDLNVDNSIFISTDKQNTLLHFAKSSDNHKNFHYCLGTNKLMKEYTGLLPSNPYSHLAQQDIAYLVFNELGECLTHETNLQNNVGYFYNYKKYDFEKKETIERFGGTCLNTPDGDNLYQILHQNQALRKEITDLFQKEYGLQFVLTPSERIFEIIKNQHGLITKYPYSSIADTFQRYIFYLAAIESNNDAVLIFEEPEVHSFPPYTKELASRIAERVENQFFITTHSPYLLHTLIEELGNDQLNVFLTYFDDYETKVKLLDEQAIRDIQDFSIDVFFNLDKLLHDA